jgi:hypothetical protein
MQRDPANQSSSQEKKERIGTKLFPVPPCSFNHPIFHILAELQVVGRRPMGIEGGFIGIDLDQQKQRRIFGILMDVEKMTARLVFEACAGMPQQTIAKPVDDISASPEVSGMKERHCRSPRDRCFGRIEQRPKIMLGREAEIVPCGREVV